MLFFCVCVCFFLIFSDFLNCVSFLPPDPRTDRALFLSGFGGPQMCTFGLSCGCWDPGCPTRKNVFFFWELHFLEPTKVATRGLTCLHTPRRVKSVILRGLSGRVWQHLLGRPNSTIGRPNRCVQQPSSRSGDVERDISECSCSGDGSTHPPTGESPFEHRRGIGSCTSADVSPARSVGSLGRVRFRRSPNIAVGFHCRQRAAQAPSCGKDTQ